MKREVFQTQGQRAVECPSESLDPLGARRRIAESAGLLDSLGRRVILARESQHGTGHHDARSSRGRGQGIAFIPARVMRVSARNLYDIDPELIEETLQLRHILDLEAPTANADGPGRQAGLGG